ncbi:hypothetical protein MMC30_009362 [Trapelia coarctata]|nr:hypothetical protein [Trapelia coarctata]
MAPTNQSPTASSLITTLLTTYQTALNTASIPTVLSLYTPDAIFMPQHSPSCIGTDAIEKAYTVIFNTIAFDVKFDIKEIVQVAPEWAFARTTSVGRTTGVESRLVREEGNQELFVLRKEGVWRIARYCFCTVNPPK